MSGTLNARRTFGGNLLSNNSNVSVVINLVRLSAGFPIGSFVLVFLLLPR